MQESNAAKLDFDQRPVVSLPIGQILRDAGKLKSADVDKVLACQNKTGLPFGEAAVRLKLVRPEDLQYALAYQYSYPYMAPDDFSLSEELVTAYDPRGAEAESFRDIRSQLKLTWFSASNRAVTIVSPGTGEGRSYVSANLAVVFSQLGGRTLLVDAALRAPRQHEIFNIENKVGLTTLLAGKADTIEPFTIPHFDNLYVLLAGPIPPNPQELLTGQRFEDLFSYFKENFDYIIVDSPAAEYYTDAELIGARVGGAMVLARKGHTRVNSAKRLLDKLDYASVPVVGAVFNNF